MDWDRKQLGGLLGARAEPRPGWSLLSLPLLVIAFEGPLTPTSAMLRLAGALLLGMLVWGMGRGPAGPRVERAFAALLLVGWFAVCGTAFRAHGVPVSIPLRLAATGGLLLGPVLLLWAWRRRARMVPVAGLAEGVAEPRSAVSWLAALALVVVALVALDHVLGLRRADLLLIGTGLVLCTAFRVRGRQRAFGALG